MVEHLGGTGIGNVGPHGAGHRVARPHPHDLTEHPDIEAPPRVEHVGEPADRSPEEVLVGDAVEPFREFHETTIPIPCPAPRRVAVERRLHLRHIGAQIERRAIGEEAPPLRVEPDQVECLIKISPGLGEDPPEDIRDREDRRPHVEAVTLLRKNRGLAADPGVLVAQRHRVATGGQRACGSQATEASPDHDHPILFLDGLHHPFLGSALAGIWLVTGSVFGGIRSGNGGEISQFEA